jgi:hypothetical protein
MSDFHAVLLPVWDVACPTCNAGVNVFCRTRSGGSLDYLGSHKQRIKLSKANKALLAMAGATPKNAWDESSGY